MNRLLTFLAPLALVACVSTPEMVPMDGPVVRTVERVVQRHDAYVEADASLSEEAHDAALLESAGALALLGLQEVSGQLLEATLEPVMSRHDAYVSSDPELDELERGLYLASTERLRALFAAVPDPVPAN